MQAVGTNCCHAAMEDHWQADTQQQCQHKYGGKHAMFWGAQQCFAPAAVCQVEQCSLNSGSGSQVLASMPRERADGCWDSIK